MKNLKKFVLEHLNNLIEADDDGGDYDRDMDMDFDPGAQADAAHDAWRDDMALHGQENPGAAEEAKKRGLIYKGWGRWADQTGNVVAQTKDGKLYSVTPQQQATGQQAAQQSSGEPAQQPQHPESREQRLAQRERLLNTYMTAYDKWLAAVKDLENQGDRNAVTTADYSGVENAKRALQDFDAKDREVVKAARDADLEKKADLDAYERAHEKGLKTT